MLFNHEIIYTHSVRFSNQITTKAVVFYKKIHLQYFIRGKNDLFSAETGRRIGMQRGRP